MSLASPVAIAGVDGCPAGWVALVLLPGSEPTVRVYAVFSDLIDTLPADAVIAVDMPIGLPALATHGGRGPETIIRRFLGQRQSSVFSIPSRAAVYAATRPFTAVEAWYEDHRLASRVARETSDPPRGVSIQSFALLPKIRELDMLLRERPKLRDNVFESHPELAFWRLNGERAMSLPKKVKGKVNPPGMTERRHLLARHGLDPVMLQTPVAGAGADDVLDAAAMLLIAARIARDEATPFPDPPLRDEHGLRVAIYA